MAKSANSAILESTRSLYMFDVHAYLTFRGTEEVKLELPQIRSFEGEVQASRLGQFNVYRDFTRTWSPVANGHNF